MSEPVSRNGPFAQRPPEYLGRARLLDVCTVEQMGQVSSVEVVNDG